MPLHSSAFEYLKPTQVQAETMATLAKRVKPKPRKKAKAKT